MYVMKACFSFVCVLEFLSFSFNFTMKMIPSSTVTFRRGPDSIIPPRRVLSVIHYFPFLFLLYYSCFWEFLSSSFAHVGVKINQCLPFSLLPLFFFYICIDTPAFIANLLKAKLMSLLALLRKQPVPRGLVLISWTAPQLCLVAHHPLSLSRRNFQLTTIVRERMVRRLGGGGGGGFFFA